MMTTLAFTLAAIASLEAPGGADTRDLAEAIAAAADERPFIGSDARKTAALLVAVAYLETGRSWDCTRVGDHGHSVSCFQIWSCPGDACETLRLSVGTAARRARDLLEESMRVCARLPVAERLSLYTSGRCQTNRESRARWALGVRLARDVKEPDAS